MPRGSLPIHAAHAKLADVLPPRGPHLARRARYAAQAFGEQRREGPDEELPGRSGWELGWLPGWELAHCLGRGRLGEVFAARPAGQSGPPAYAVKLLHPALARRPEAILTFEREVELGRLVSHPHLVPILAAQLSHNPPAVVMPLVSGRRADELPIWSFLRRGAVHAWALPLWHMRQVAQALAALHKAGWTHGDVSPGNILVASNGHATLIDLGFAQRLGETASPDHSTLGAARYLAPELFSARHALDGRSDLYSLGAAWYELLAGRPLFESDRVEKLAEMHRTSQPAPLAQWLPGVPPEIDRLLARLLCKNPIRRAASAHALAEELMQLELCCFGDRGRRPTSPRPAADPLAAGDR